MFLNLGEVSLFRECSLCHQMVRDQLWSRVGSDLFADSVMGLLDYVMLDC